MGHLPESTDHTVGFSSCWCSAIYSSHVQFRVHECVDITPEELLHTLRHAKHCFLKRDLRNKALKWCRVEGWVRGRGLESTTAWLLEAWLFFYSTCYYTEPVGSQEDVFWFRHTIFSCVTEILRDELKGHLCRSHRWWLFVNSRAWSPKFVWDRDL